MRKKYSIRVGLVLVVCLLFSSTTYSNISLPAIFGNHMVMQQNAELKLWGWGKPFENVSVIPSWSSDTLKTVVNNNGNWFVMLSTPSAGATHSLVIQGYNKVVVDDILMGDVWLCSGQSNMEWSAAYGIDHGEAAIKNATHNELRLFHVTWRTSPYKCIDVDGKWVKCTPETMRDFSAIAYFFGRELNEVLHVPVGLISSNWGGTPIEAWIPENEIESNTQLCDAANKIPYFPWAPNKPGYTYNAMIAPIMPFAIKGVLWYQGEANVDNSYAYTDMLSLLVSNWRHGFKSDFSFYYAQIAPFVHYQNYSGVEVRDAQRRALKQIPNSGMVIFSDIGDTLDIHPRNKVDAGKRFAHLALNATYGLKEYPFSGPLYKQFLVRGNKVEVTFNYSEGLYCADSSLDLFELAAEDEKWYPAKAVIKNDKVVVSSEQVDKPVHVRFAWRNSATPKLFNRFNLPASSFTTVEWQNIKHAL